MIHEDVNQKVALDSFCTHLYFALLGWIYGLDNTDISIENGPDFFFTHIWYINECTYL